MINMRSGRVRRSFLLAAMTLGGMGWTNSAGAQEPAACLSADPAVWPKSSKPYFMLLVDTSGSMITSVAGAAPSCGYPATRMGHAKCAVKNTVLAFSGQVNFGLAQYAGYMTGCGASCYGNDSGFPQPACVPNCYNAEINTTGICGLCGPMDNTADPTTRRGATVLVGMQQDNFWSSPPSATNVPQILNYVDNNCTSNLEVTNTPTDGPAYGRTPLNGSLRDMRRYFQTGWTNPDNGAITFPTPLSANDRPCRSVNVILLTDGDETCDTQANAVNAASVLFNTGVTIGTNTFKIKTYVINFAGGNQANTDAIAAAGGTTSSYFATNEVQLSQALATIVGSSVAPETCDNVDNNCNGCTDEGFTHYCNTGQTCCAWTTAAQRNACLTTYQGTITPANPSGDVTKLPCTTVLQQTQAQNWLCYDPKEICDNVDNNCSAGVDEGVTKCGSPAHCPTGETCNGQDDDCDGIVDDGVCSGCVPSPEVCDGCDNDCDGLIDEGIASVACGLTSPANCVGTLACPQKTNPGGMAGTCVAGNPYGTCTNSPQTEVCDTLDNDCDGQTDEGLPATACVPNGTPGGLIYGAPSQCRQGTKACGSTQCIGFIGPSTEVCDGIDNDCDGQIDEGVAGVGQQCGTATGECSTGVTACVGGTLVCQGGVGPANEVCDNLDNDCDGQTDETPLANGPPAGMNGCWTLPGNCCTFGGTSWCPPPGGTCNGNGTLTAPCNRGTLACVAGGWVCQNAKGPATEVCDSVDNDCDGQSDEGLSGSPCGTNTGECVAGTVQCTNGVSSCVGSVGPTTETCNNKDDDCDGQTDEGIGGLGAACGNSTPPCMAGTTACVGGNIICQGAVLPQNEICDGVDNNCNGQTDEGQLSDAPPAGQNGCWTLPGNCCTFGTLSWCPPQGGTCSGNGTLTAPCNKGTLTCSGAAGWSCVGPVGPGAEVCDGTDNNCDGNVDNVPPVACVPQGTPGGLNYGGNSQCKMGTQTCSTCMGFVGPSAELCDGIDNDCDGTVDEGAFGTGQACGVNQAPCVPGTTACVAGSLVCQGGVGPQNEICDGIDNNCDGTPDNAPLSDAPPAGQNGCWADAGNCCSFANLNWCPPPGATCSGNGTLTAPCNFGALACAGAAGWVCQNPKGPLPESCDGLDNDCNGMADDGTLAGVGGVCGTDTGECQTGVITCTAGVLDCAGDIPPSPETCDGLDNDCEGNIDNGIPLGGSCLPMYDTTLYPGDRTSAPCQPGVLQCDGAGGLICVGGVGPNPEVCDGLDNDCDGTVDEVGNAPDGLNGTANPLPPPMANIGEACGQNEGICMQGTWACENGVFICLGGQGPAVEECDCTDNDCNGVPDNGADSTCTQGKVCVKGANGCQCAAPCATGEFPCPPGQKCESVTKSDTGDPLPMTYCTTDFEALCGDCTTKTVKDANNTVLCAPAGTELPGCIKPPVCKCNGPAGCGDPCTGVTCSMGSVCAPSGPNAGKCVLDNCFNVPCQGCGKVCNQGSCVDNPCKADSCPADQACVPDGTFTGFTCVPSCAGATCSTGQTCVDGVCVATCDPPCAMGQTCDTTGAVPTCVADKCNPNPCNDGACCQTTNGGTSFVCGNCPCEGVLCPTGQVCQAGNCVSGQGGAGGSGGGMMTGSSSSSSGSMGGGGMGGSGEKPEVGIWGLPTGGGGCSCDVPASSSNESSFGLFAAACALAEMRRRKRAKDAVAKDEVTP